MFVDKKNMRRRRSTDSIPNAMVTKSTGKEEKQGATLRKTNSASALLGLSFLLYPDINEYDGVALNNFYGFRVSWEVFIIFSRIRGLNLFN